MILKILVLTSLAHYLISQIAPSFDRLVLPSLPIKRSSVD